MRIENPAYLVRSFFEAWRIVSCLNTMGQVWWDVLVILVHGGLGFKGSLGFIIRPCIRGEDEGELVIHESGL